MSKRKFKHKRKRKNPDYPQNCYMCEHCVYIGEGGYICDMSNDIVIEDWQPTDDFYFCDGKDFEKVREVIELRISVENPVESVEKQ